MTIDFSPIVVYLLVGLVIAFMVYALFVIADLERE